MHDDPNERDYTWPTADATRAPFWVFSDPKIYEGEHEKIFRGKVWNFLCLEVDIPNAGDYRTATVGKILSSSPGARMAVSTPWSTDVLIRARWSA